MKEEFSELVEYLDGKFEKTATKEEIQEFRSEMNEKFTEVHVEVVVLREDVKEIKGTLSQLQEDGTRTRDFG